MTIVGSPQSSMAVDISRFGANEKDTQRIGSGWDSVNGQPVMKNPILSVESIRVNFCIRGDNSKNEST